MRQNTHKRISILGCLLLLISYTGCTNSSKELVKQDLVKEEIKQEQKQEQKVTNSDCFEFSEDKTGIIDYFEEGTKTRRPCPRDVVIPNGIKYIHRDAFKDKGLKSVVIPNSVTDIGYGAFSKNQLTQVTIPGEARVATHAFSDNPFLASVCFKRSASFLSMLETSKRSDEKTLFNESAKIYYKSDESC